MTFDFHLTFVIWKMKVSNQTFKDEVLSSVTIIDPKRTESACIIIDCMAVQRCTIIHNYVQHMKSLRNCKPIEKSLKSKRADLGGPGVIPTNSNVVYSKQ